MIQSLTQSFIESFILGEFSVSTSSLASTTADTYDKPDGSTSMSLTMTSASSTLLVSANATNIETQVEDTQMIIESMSIEELEELKNSIIDKENTLTLHTK